MCIVSADAETTSRRMSTLSTNRSHPTDSTREGGRGNGASQSLARQNVRSAVSEPSVASSVRGCAILVLLRYCSVLGVDLVGLLGLGVVRREQRVAGVAVRDGDRLVHVQGEHLGDGGRDGVDVRVARVLHREGDRRGVARPALDVDAQDALDLGQVLLGRVHRGAVVDRQGDDGADVATVGVAVDLGGGRGVGHVLRLGDLVQLGPVGGVDLAAGQADLDHEAGVARDVLDAGAGDPELAADVGDGGLQLGDGDGLLAEDDAGDVVAVVAGVDVDRGEGGQRVRGGGLVGLGRVGDGARHDWIPSDRV